MPQWVRNQLTPLGWVAGVTAVLLLLFPYGFPNYDTIYALLWGREMAHGMSPDMGAALPPTPHPLAELFGLVATPLGDGAIDLTMVVAYTSLGLVGYLVYRLGSLWFDRPIGAVAALLVLTRAPFLSNGIRAYVDLPYIALCLGALVIETRRQEAIAREQPEPEESTEARKGSKNRLGREGLVLALLALAGLLRPEAWLFSVAYLAYLLLAPEQSARDREGEERTPLERADTQSAGLIRPALVRARGVLSSPHGGVLISLALAAPIAWALFDWITAGSPTYSFTGTRETVETLARQTGPVDLVLYGPRRLGEVLQWPGMVGALGGILLTLGLMRRGRRLNHLPPNTVVNGSVGIAAAVLALAAFAVLATAGLAIIPRYTMLAAAILAVFAAFALLGWRMLERGDPWRRAWRAFAAFVALMFVAWGPSQYDLLRRVDVDLTNQARIEDDLNDIAGSGAFEPLCLPISVPNHRAVPRLAFDLDVRPSRIVSASEQRQPRRGYFLDPASDFVIHNFVLDPNDPARLKTHVPPGFHPVARNESWILYRRCG